MKRLYLMRHAKSDWSDGSLDDIDRPLNHRGEKAAPFMAKFLRRASYLIDALITSPAERALRTAEAVAEEFGLSPRVDTRIYEASVGMLFEVISGIDDRNPSAMLVGHDPAMSGGVRALTGNALPLPTAAVAVIDLSVESWTAIEPNAGKLCVLLKPKDLMG